MIEVSVIMAVYNTENKRIIVPAINSILNQSIKDLELIICDDGSVDKTYDLLEDISRKDSRIVLIRNNTNMGASVARNRCMAIAKGQFIAIMDADDYSHRERLEKQITFLKNNPEYAFVGAKGRYFNSFGEKGLGNYWFCEYPLKEDFLFTLPFVHGSIVFRKQVISAVDGYREAHEVTRSEDYDLLMRLYARDYYGANLKEVLYFIRLDEGSYKRRKYMYRVNEFVVKYKGFRKLGLMPRGLIYAIKPMVIGLVPIRLLKAMKNRYYKSK